MTVVPASSRSSQDAASRDALEQIAHDLKSPLTTVRLCAELLRYRAEHGELAAAEIVRGLARVEAAAASMAVMVEALLDLARDASGAPPDLQPVLVDLVGLVRGVAAGRSASVESDLPVMLVDCDGVRLTRALAGLLDRLPGVRLNIRDDTTWAVLEVRAEGAAPPDPIALRRLVEAHGGALSAEPGRSALVLRLPR
jgi:K+-sensing histidine kinase KdpD